MPLAIDPSTQNIQRVTDVLKLRFGLEDQDTPSRFEFDLLKDNIDFRQKLNRRNTHLVLAITGLIISGLLIVFTWTTVAAVC